ncbi:hypothetical protein DL240_15610 [Lujinxingia litoralis]|uniref:ABC transporter domain-containing protein n=1 Tax=Lujinxingia litoralis TaxID=2211119 RepID=A0A328C3A9_9DELT|nr:ABC transporter ATP-binding protein [Lujinxingia litoralis]RAL20743.1 hypothetical protein DL240_15610 [Lujinxingia litoralis]
MSAPLLRVHNLSWTPPDHDAPLWSGVTFELGSGQRLALEGESGSGKSTLLRAIIGLLPGSTGQVYWRGQPLSPDTIRSVRRQLVYLHQRPAPLATTLGQELALARHYADFRPDDTPPGLDEDAQRQLLDLLGLGDLRDHHPFDRLSPGQQQRLALVRALTLKPRALLLDEPTASLDPERRDLVEALLLRYLNDDPTRALIWISHSRQQRQRLATRTLSIHRWRPPASTSP